MHLTSSTEKGTSYAGCGQIYRKNDDEGKLEHELERQTTAEVAEINTFPAIKSAWEATIILGNPHLRRSHRLISLSLLVFEFRLFRTRVFQTPLTVENMQ